MEVVLEKRLFAVLAVLIALLAFTGEPVDTVDATFYGNEAVNVTLEVAETPAERKRGLMFERELKPRHGMLFVFEEDAPRSFWMKNTFIPLDIIFVDSNMSVTGVERADPEPGVPEEKLESYRGYGKYVVEMEQGFAGEYGIEEGSRLELPE